MSPAIWPNVGGFYSFLKPRPPPKASGRCTDCGCFIHVKPGMPDFRCFHCDTEEGCPVRNQGDS